ncbi:MAG: T9SS type A sorting domain-containing protein [Vicingaceae bacterium]
MESGKQLAAGLCHGAFFERLCRKGTRELATLFNDIRRKKSRFFELKRGLQILTLLLFFHFASFSQNIQEITFDTEFLLFSNPLLFANTQPYLHIEGDGTLNLSFTKSDSTQDYAGERWHYRLDQQLQVIDSFRVWKRRPYYRPPGNTFIEYTHNQSILKNGLTDSLYHYEVLIPNDSSVEVNLYASQPDLKRGIKLIDLTLSGNREMVPYVYDTTLTLIFERLNNTPIQIKSYSLVSGNLIKEDTNSAQGMPLWSFNIPQVSKVQPNYQNPEEVFLFMQGSLYNLALVNWKTQKFEKVYVQYTPDISDSLVVRHQVTGEEYTDVWIEDTNSFHFLGCHDYSPTPNTYDYSYQIAIHEISNQDSLLSVREFGNNTTSSTNDECGMVYKKFGQTEYIAGRRDKEGGYYLRDTAEAILFIVDSTRRDSLYFFGSKNHRPVDLQKNDAGDIFILTMSSKPFTTWEAQVSVIKIPASLLTAVEKQQVSRKLYLYPNPTTDRLVSDEFVNAAQIRIYDLKGSLKKQISSRDKQISLAGLRSGTYLIQVLKADNTSSSGIVVKQ